jgi:hypothetical protein
MRRNWNWLRITALALFLATLMLIGPCCALLLIGRGEHFVEFDLSRNWTLTFGCSAANIGVGFRQDLPSVRVPRQWYEEEFLDFIFVYGERIDHMGICRRFVGFGIATWFVLLVDCLSIFFCVRRLCKKRSYGGSFPVIVKNL